MKRLQEKYIGELLMKKLLNFKNSLIMMLGVLLCLSGLISCSITIDLSTDNNGQVIENLKRVDNKEMFYQEILKRMKNL